MSIERFEAEITRLINIMEQILGHPSRGQPEAETKNRLIEPFLNALGYGSEYRTPEGTIRSLRGTTNWVDYLLRDEANSIPKLMFEVKSLWDNNIWEQNKQQVFNYLRDYSLDIANDRPVLWIILSNFKEWYILRLQDRTPFWQFTIDELGKNSDLISQIYNCLARENLRTNQLESYYAEKTKEGLGERFLADLKIWRVILANGISTSQPELDLEKIREASQIFLNRFLLIRLLEAFSPQMPYNYLGRLYYNWQTTFYNLPFIEHLRDGFRNTWAGYNTELFHHSWVDELVIGNEYLEPIIIMNAIPRDGLLYNITSNLVDYRSLYNYDFTTLNQDVLGMAYEQFLAHQLIEENGIVKILENSETRKREGVFYTPSYIVSKIVRQTLSPLVKVKIDQAIRLLESREFDEAYEVAYSVLDCTICDPACGSGSFLLGAFDYILDEFKRYNKACDNPDLTSGNGDFLSSSSPQPIINGLEEKIIVKMLHGVDRDPQAVLLAKLSLWTRLLRAKPDRYGRRNNIVSRLPALTLNIRTGDSLIHSPMNLEPLKDDLIKSADLANRARDTSIPESERISAVNDLESTIDLINTRINPILTSYFASEESLRSVVRMIKNREASDAEIRAIRSYLINSDQRGLSNNWTETELERLRSELMVIPSAQDDVIIKRPFNWQVEFPHVFDPRLENPGFTAIIGNPPYFNVDATFGRNALELLWLKAMYSDIYTDKTDILFYFLRRGYELLQTHGYLTFIVSRAFIQGDKSQKLREFLARQTKLISIFDFLGHKVFKAGISTCIIQFQKELATDDHNVMANCVLNFNEVKTELCKKNPNLSNLQGLVNINLNQKSLGGERWKISPYGHIFSVIDRKTKIRDVSHVTYMEGITTGKDSIFEGNFVDLFPRKFLCERIPNSSIQAFGYKPSNTQLIYYTHDCEWNSLPNSLKIYLQNHRNELESREVFQNNTSSYEWFHLHRPRNGILSPKIFFPRRANSNKFVVDPNGSIGFKSDVAGFVKAENTSIDRLYFICALLNSEVLEFRYRALGGIGKLTGRGMFEYFENQVGDLPIPDLSEDNPDFQTLVSLSKEAHQIWNERFRVITEYKNQTSAIPYDQVSASYYHDIAGDYGADVKYVSSQPNLEGHLLSLKVEAQPDGYILCGEVTENEDWREGERYWLEIVRITIYNSFLRRYLLASLIYTLEFDLEFRRKQKLTEEFGNILRVAFDVLKVNRFDEDKIRNLRTLELIEQRVLTAVGRSDLENLLLRQIQIQSEINQIAYRLYGVEEYKNIITDALKIIL